MEMKEIIIDGVNVAGCEFYQIEANQLYPKAQYCGSMRNTFCENEPNCYYKQLKRLEQENAELKEKLIARGKSVLACIALEEVDKYKQTLNAIKEIAENAPAIDTELSQRILEVITKAEVGE